jgi:glycosyltransferase involved in cell wall biosynthesis
MKSVAIVGTRGYPSYYGGFETAVRKLAPHLADEGWDVTVYGRPGATKNGDSGRDDRVHSVLTRGLETKSLSTLSYGLTAIIDVLKRKPDVVLVMNVANGYWLPLLRLRGIPSAVNVDGIEWDRAKWGRLAKKVFHFGARMTAKFGSRMIYDAEEIARRWKAEFHLDGDFIPYGGDVPPSLPIEPGLSHRGYALLVARFVPENTVQEFLEAAKEISKTHDVVVVGSSGYGGEVDDAVRKLSGSNVRVRWLGHVSDDQRLLALWQHAGAYFHGHSVGGTNPALVQAMACGAPVVARDTPYNREVLGPNGQFVDPAPADIAREVLRLLDDPGLQARAAADGLERALDRYTWAGVCRGYEAILNRLIPTPVDDLVQ